MKLNGLRQDDAAKIFNVSRQTINVWCKSDVIDDKIVKQIYERFRVTDPSVSPINLKGNSNIVAQNNSSITADNRQYYSDAPDVLRAQCDELEERIKEKDAQIKEKDAQIKEKDAQIKEKDAQIKEKDAQIKEKDAQIKEKDAQIGRLLGIVERMSAGGVAGRGERDGSKSEDDFRT